MFWILIIKNIKLFYQCKFLFLRNKVNIIRESGKTLFAKRENTPRGARKFIRNFIWIDTDTQNPSKSIKLSTTHWRRVTRARFLYPILAI